MSPRSSHRSEQIAHNRRKAVRLAMPRNVETFDVDRPPSVVGVPTLCAVFGYSPAHVHRLIKRGAFDFLRATPAVGKKRWSGYLLARHLRGEDVTRPALAFGRRTFGQQRGA